MVYNLMSISFLFGATPSENWPGFRGDGSSVVSSGSLPLEWMPAKNIAWKADLPGYGQSSPVIWNDTIFLTAVDGKEKEKCIVVAFNAAMGAILWKKEFEASQKGKNNPMMSRAAPTPVVDEKAVYASFESGDIICCSHSGAELWKRSISMEVGEFKNNHGIGSSLAQTANAVIFLLDHAGPSFLLAIDKATGKNLWKTQRESRTSWTSPVSCEVNGRELVLVSSSGNFGIYGASDGKLLASMDGLVGNNIPSPTFHKGLIFIGSGENRMNPDPKASAKSNCMLMMAHLDGKTSLGKNWEASKAISHHASPLAYEGVVYFVTKSGLVHALDMNSGKELFVERLDSQCWATPVAGDGRVYFFGKDGVTTVIKAGPKFEKLATNRIWGKVEFDKNFELAKKKASDSMAGMGKGGPGGFTKSKNGESGSKDEKKSNSVTEKGQGGRGGMSPQELEAARYSAVGDVVYGVAASKGRFFLRAGDSLFCIKAAN
jgi:outer membrane protein assembly factor BamB